MRPTFWNCGVTSLSVTTPTITLGAYCTASDKGVITTKKFPEIIDLTVYMIEPHLPKIRLQPRCFSKCIGE